MNRWVKIIGLLVLLLLLVAIGALLLLPDDEGGGHTPRRHGSAPLAEVVHG